MEFIWNDGGRATAGFVGLAGDCVARSIAIGTGLTYRQVYTDIGQRTAKTPRNGVDVSVAADFLEALGWQQTQLDSQRFVPLLLPKATLILHLVKESRRGSHFSTLIDHVIHDTWNPAEDEEYLVAAYWSRPDSETASTLPVAASQRATSVEQDLTQSEFEKIMRRLRALDKTASNHASTEGEKRNALRMMQTLMLTHNLSRQDIVEQDNVDQVQFTRMACPLNGRRACTWEKSLAWYVAREVFPTVQWYMSARANRTWFWFYGPVSDVENCITLFRELLLTIATYARLHYGGVSRGSGASYAEGYVAGLPRFDDDRAHEVSSQSRELIHSRTIALHNTARRWLSLECDVQLGSSTTRGRYQHDAAAAHQGRKHGASQKIHFSGRQKRLT
jgi:hypothetical protein